MKKSSSTTIRSLALACASLYLGSVQAQAPDPQQLQQMLMQQLGMLQQPQGAAQPQQQRQPALTEQALAQRLATWPAAKGPFKIERFRDGFSIDNRRVLDPEGRIVQFAVDGATGDAAYMVEIQPNSFLLKLMRHRAGAPVLLATATRQYGNWTVDTVTGVRVAGPRLNVNSRGFIVARDNALFRYQPGEGLQSFGLPETHTLAAHQNGNVGATGWLLLEKRAETKKEEGGFMKSIGLGEVFDAAKQVVAAVGLASADSDFALYELETGKTVPLAISLADKQTNLLSQCRARNRWVQQCDRLDTIESLYAQDGSPNRMHYFWRLSWYKTDSGPVAVLMENNLQKIQALDLSSERRAVVFERALGIAGWSSSQQPDGRVRVNAQLGFESAVNEDVGQLLQTAPATVAAGDHSAPTTTR